MQRARNGTPMEPAAEIISSATKAVRSSYYSEASAVAEAQRQRRLTGYLPREKANHSAQNRGSRTNQFLVAAGSNAAKPDGGEGEPVDRKTKSVPIFRSPSYEFATSLIAKIDETV